MSVYGRKNERLLKNKKILKKSVQKLDIDPLCHGKNIKKKH
jgi:hypothetical protein